MGFLKSALKVALNPYNPASYANLASDFSGKSQQQDANEKAMQAWNLANDYNSPAAQVARLEAAGLNKYLVNLSGNTAGVPGLTGGNVMTGTQSVFSGLSNIMGVLQGKANLDNTYAQTQASTAAAGASAAQANNLDAQTSINRKKADYEEKGLIADIDYKRALAQKTQAEATIAQAEANLFEPVAGVKGAELLKNVGKGVLGIAKKLPAGALVSRFMGR